MPEGGRKKRKPRDVSVDQVPLGPPAVPTPVSPFRPGGSKPKDDSLGVMLSKENDADIVATAIQEFKDSLIYFKGFYIEPSTVVGMALEEGHYADQRSVKIETTAGRFSQHFAEREKDKAEALFLDIVTKVLKR